MPTVIHQRAQDLRPQRRDGQSQAIGHSFGHLSATQVGERLGASEHLPQQDAKAVRVASFAVVGLVSNDLGRHPSNGTVVGRVGLTVGLLLDAAHAKVRHVSVPVLIDQYVASGNVAMNDLLAMQMQDAGRRVTNNLDQGLLRQLQALESHEIVQAPTRIVLRHDTQIVGVHADANESNDRWMVGYLVIITSE